LNHKNYVTKIAETMIFDKSGGAQMRYTVTFTFRVVAAA
jgi:hypothetical protein